MSARSLAAVLFVLCASASGPALADARAEDGFERVEARLCSQFEVCEPPCGSTESESAASDDAR